MKHTIAKKLKADGSRYDGVPRALIESIVEDTLHFVGSHVDNSVTIELLDEIEPCEGCDEWALPGDMKRCATEDRGDTVYLCKSCQERA